MRIKPILLLSSLSFILSCDSDDVLATYDSRKCLLVANSFHGISELTIWIDSGSKNITYKPHIHSSSINICEIISDSFNLDTSNVSLVSVTFTNNNKKTGMQVEFNLQSKSNPLIELKPSKF